jgi:hypothetical protein
MTKDDILSMAKEAGIDDWWESGGNWRSVLDGHLERLAALVAEKATEQANARQNASWALMCKKMVVAEREECVKILHDNATNSKGMAVHALIASAQQIEARGKK